MQILGTAQARQVVKPTKPQPKKIAPAPQTVSENGVSTPVAVLPATTVKKVVPPPAQKTAQPATQQGQGNDFNTFFQNLYPTPPPVDTQAVQQPYLDEYNKELAQLNTGQQTENTFDTKLAGELEGLLSSNGIDPGLAKSLQAALQVEALRNSGNTYAFAQGKLTDNYFGANGIIPGALSAANDAYNKSLPTGSDELSAWTAYNDQQNKSQAAQLAGAKYNLSVKHENFNEALQTLKVSGPKAASTGTWTAKPSGNGKYVLVNNKTGEIRQTGVSVKQSAGSTGTWKTVASGDGTYKLVNSKTGAIRPTNIPVKKSASGGTVKMQLKNIGGKVAYFNPVTGKITQTKLPYGSPKTPKTLASVANPNSSTNKQLRAFASNAYYGVKSNTSKDGKDHPPVTYQMAIQEMVRSGLSRASAVAAANRFYVHPWQRSNGWYHGLPGPSGG